MGAVGSTTHCFAKVEPDLIWLAKPNQGPISLSSYILERKPLNIECLNIIKVEDPHAH